MLFKFFHTKGSLIYVSGSKFIPLTRLCTLFLAVMCYQLSVLSAVNRTWERKQLGLKAETWKGPKRTQTCDQKSCDREPNLGRTAELRLQCLTAMATSEAITAAAVISKLLEYVTMTSLLYRSLKWQLNSLNDCNWLSLDLAHSVRSSGIPDDRQRYRDHDSSASFLKPSRGHGDVYRTPSSSLSASR